MTTFENRPRSALLVVDVQNGVVGEAHQRDATVATIAGLVERARSQEVPVIWVQQTDENLEADSDAWQVVPELVPGEDEPRVRKAFGDSFEDTELEQLLAERSVGRLVVVGAQTDACIRSTIHGAFTRGYDTTLVSDAHTTEDLTAYGAPAPADVIAHTNLYWTFQAGPGRTAAVVEAADVELSPV
jgi:nicotinamidase-related amidase